MKLKIAVVQFDIKQYCSEDNLVKAEKFIKLASGKSNIIVFPEDFITGPIKFRQDLVDSDGKFKKHFQRLAKEYNIDIVTGSFLERDEKGIYNTTYYIDSKGVVKSRYRKVNLWHPERSYIKPGKEVPVFKTRYGKIGLIICWDLVFPEIFRKMLKQGVEIVICPSYWCVGDAGEFGIVQNKNSEVCLVNSLSSGRAFENEIIFVYCNAAGKMDLGKYKDTLIGRSQVSAPFKGVLNRFDHNKEGMFIQEIDTDILKGAEKVYKIRQDLKNRVV